MNPRTDAYAMSPCVGICCFGSDGHCIGCYRSVAEIRGWQSTTYEERLAILELCRERQRSAEAGGDTLQA